MTEYAAPARLLSRSPVATRSSPKSTHESVRRRRETRAWKSRRHSTAGVYRDNTRSKVYLPSQSSVTRCITVPGAAVFGTNSMRAVREA